MGRGNVEEMEADHVPELTKGPRPQIQVTERVPRKISKKNPHLSPPQ